MVLGLSVEWSFGCSDESCVSIAAVLPGGDGTWVLWRLFGAHLTSPVNPVCRYCVARYCFVDGSMLAYGDCCLSVLLLFFIFIVVVVVVVVFFFVFILIVVVDVVFVSSNNSSSFVRMTRPSNFFS